MSPDDRLQSRYTVQSALGSGAQATVWQCLNTVTDTLVAIKHASDPREWPNARREYVLLRLLNLPGVVPILDEWVDDTGWYVVMPLLQGGAFPEEAEWSQVRALVQSTLATLAAMHARGVVHADLKPENMVVNGDTVTLIDLGFAMDRHAATDLSGFTLDYAAPELWFGQPATGASDVFALARVAAQALGARPEAHADVHAAHGALLSAVAALPVPQEAVDLLVSMLAWEPSERPSAAQAAASLGFAVDRVFEIRSRHRFDHTAEDMKALLSSGSVSLQWLLDAGMGHVEDDAVYFTREEVSRLELALAPRSNEPDAPPLGAVDSGDVEMVLAWCEDSVARPERLRWSLPLARWCVGHTQATVTDRHLDALALFTSLAVHSEQAPAMHDAALTVDRAAVCAVGEQCAEVLRAAIAVRTQGRLQAESVTRVVESTPLHGALEPAMTLVKVWQMRSDMDGLWAWLEAELELEEDAKKVGRLLTWLSIVAYKQQDYEVGLAAIERKREMGCEVTLSDLSNEADLLLETGRHADASSKAQAFERLADRYRMADVEIGAVRTRRSADYRAGRLRTPNAQLSREGAKVSPWLGATMALTEAAIAFRYHHPDAALLATNAHQGFGGKTDTGPACLAAALRYAVLGDAAAATRVAEHVADSGVGPLAVQALGLCRFAGAAVDVHIHRGLVLTPSDDWERWREVLSIRESLAGRPEASPIRGRVPSKGPCDESLFRELNMSDQIGLNQIAEGRWGLWDGDVLVGRVLVEEKSKIVRELWELDVDLERFRPPTGLKLVGSVKPKGTIADRLKVLQRPGSAKERVKWYSNGIDAVPTSPKPDALPSVNGIRSRLRQDDKEVGWAFHETDGEFVFKVHHFMNGYYCDDRELKYGESTDKENLKESAKNGEWYSQSLDYFVTDHDWRKYS